MSKGAKSQLFLPEECWFQIYYVFQMI